MKPNLKFVIVGHVDHGKSTLIGRLLYETNSLPDGFIEEVRKTCENLGREMEFAFILDSLEEEREQNVTIDTSQTFYNTEKRTYTIIDAPGHIEFTKNMITGASQAEAAILIIDANEGVKEQTRRHAYILNLLGLKQVIVVINKMDLVNYSEEKFNALKKEISTFLAELKVNPLYVIPISAKNGDNIAKKTQSMNWYKGTMVLDALDALKASESLNDLPLRMPVQDVYKIDNKRIIAGRVEAGTIKAGQEIIILPSKMKTKVKSVEKFLSPDKTTAVAGESIGITTEDSLFLDRGNVICTEGLEPIITKTIKGNLFWMSKTPLKKGESVKLKCATQEVSCIIKEITRRIDSSNLNTLENSALELKNREVGEIVFETSENVIIDDFNKTPALGRFIIERNFDAAGGGIITI